MAQALLIFPHQLFADHPGLAEAPDRVVLVEEPLFFGDPVYPAVFHKQKLWLHRASLARYQARLEAAGHAVARIAYQRDADLLRGALADLSGAGIETILVADPVDFTLSKRLRAAAEAAQLTLEVLTSPGFINSGADNRDWAQGRKRWFMAEFYKSQRRRLDVMMVGDTPEGGQW
ncbi:MAG: cryptochrome/photolyase family protein, partial [Pseudomonadota bacterium]